MSKHPNADILKEIADEAQVNERYWEAFEWSGRGICEWFVHDNETQPFCQIEDSDYEVRRKPHTINIGGMEVSEPLREPPEYGTFVYEVKIGTWTRPSHYQWEDAAIDYNLLEKGLLHLDEDAAIQHARALIAVSGGNAD